MQTVLGETLDNDIHWINCFLHRVLFDFLNDKYWANKIQERVQRKLSKLRIPYFVGDIVVTGVEMGGNIPLFRKCGTPVIDDRGLWMDVDLTYTGSFEMTLETRLDLMKLKENAPLASPRKVSYPSITTPISHSRVYSCIDLFL